ncbi:L-asparaginase [Streptacidiphilus jiangxiensis]|uniref:L-asparaginase n=2 Tax=Streptacidiphilus jiangxiensis TaxID=235985 RepID=A0A1H7X8V6_STRJI|nr:L-asparaginase [Streptacidiphilus jiangxiensis]
MASATSGGAPAQLHAGKLATPVPGLAAFANVAEIAFRQVASTSLTIEDIYQLADAIDAELDAGATGVVVAQGTDTLEESAYLLDLLLHRTAPVVVTGAMRTASAVGSDGPANLLDAVTLAASGMDCGGVSVVMAGEIHAARRVSKVHSFLPAAFASPRGPLGVISEGRVGLDTRAAASSPVIERLPRGPIPSVPIVTLGLGDDGVLLRAAADAVIIEMFGAGHAPAWLVNEIETLAREVPLIMTSRTRNGLVLRETYGYQGPRSICGPEVSSRPVR